MASWKCLLFSFLRMYQLVKPPTYRYIPCWPYTPSSKSFSPYMQKWIWEQISQHVCSNCHHLACGTGPTSCPVPVSCISLCISDIMQKSIFESKVSRWMRRMMTVIMQIQASMERVHLLLLNRIGYINLKDEKRELFSTNNEDRSRGSEDNATRTWSQYFISIVSGKKAKHHKIWWKAWQWLFFFYPLLDDISQGTTALECAD